MPVFEVHCAGVETVVFCSSVAADEFAWCLEPLGTTWPFEAVVHVSETHPIAGVTFNLLEPKPPPGIATYAAPQPITRRH